MKRYQEIPFRVGITLALLLFLIFSILFLYVCTNIFHSSNELPYRAAVVLSEFDYQVQKVVVLDAGHGAHDSGAQSADGILEKDLNLAIAQKIGVFLSFYNVDVIYTRYDDTLPNLIDNTSKKRGEILSRAKIAEDANADLFLSIHMNAFPSASCRGAQVFYSNQNSENEWFAKTLQSAICTLVQTDNRRSAKNTELLFLLTNLKMPAALLECGFLSNAEDTKLLCEVDYQNKLAFCIAQAIIDHLFSS